MKKENFILECSKLGVEITEELYSKLYLYYEELVKWNKMFNLTTITDYENVFLKHFYDSLTIVNSDLINNDIKLCDFGTGAGFPGMVIAIVFDKIDVTLIESSNKKCKFLMHIASILNLNNVNVICARAEEYSRDNREYFDIVTCRAVSSLAVISELAASMVKIGGNMIFLKSSYDLELEKSKDLISDLGFKFIKVVNFTLPDGKSERNILIFKKVSKTPEGYPRSYSIIAKNVLKK